MREAELTRMYRRWQQVDVGNGEVDNTVDIPKQLNRSKNFEKATESGDA